MHATADLHSRCGIYTLVRLARGSSAISESFVFFGVVDRSRDCLAELHRSPSQRANQASHADGSVVTEG